MIEILDLIDHERVVAAAALGYQPAIDVVGKIDVEPILSALEKLSHKDQVRFAAECAQRVLHLFESKYPDDKRPREAIKAALAFIQDTGAANAARAAANAARVAANAARVAAYAARVAAYAAYAAAYAAANAANVAADAAANAAAYAAYAARAADATNATSAAGPNEKAWQRSRLIELLLPELLAEA